MTTCVRCGGALRDGAAFCRHCGADQRPPAEASPTPPSSDPAPPSTCSRCGAALRPGGRFCRECGTPVEDHATPARSADIEDRDHAATVVDPPPAAARPEPREVPTAATAPSPRPVGDATLVDPGPAAAAPSSATAAATTGGGTDRRIVLLGGAALLVIAVAVVLALSLGSGDEQGEPRQARSPGTTGARTSPSPPSTTSTRGGTTPRTATTTAPAPAPAQRLTATVDRTCGSDGRADCFVSVRAQPSAGAAELRRLSEGASVRIVCQVSDGSSTYSSVLGSSTTLWSKTASGGYVTNAYLSGHRINPTSRSLPRC